MHAPPAQRNADAILLVVLVGQFMAALDTTVANVAAPAISADLAVGPGVVALAVAAYTLLYASLLVTGARLGADRGRREVYLAGLALFTFASAAAGAAPSAAVLIGARALQGLGAALMIPQVISFIQLSFTGEARSRALAIYGAMIGLGATVGLTAGGWLLGLDVLGLGWRTVFLINVPIGVLLLLGAARALPRVPVTPSQFDVVGVVVLTAGAMALTAPLAVGPGLDWPAWTAVSFAAGVLLLAGFVAHERGVSRRGRRPLLDPAIFAAPGVRPGLATLLLSGTAYTGILFCVAGFLQERTGATPLHAGLALAPFAAGFGLGSWAASPTPLRHHRRLVVAGLVLMAGAFAGLSATTTASVWHWRSGEVLLAVAGLGYGASFNPLLGLTIANVRATHVADASGISTTTFQFSYVLGVAGFGSLYHGASLAAALAAMAALSLLGVASFTGARRSQGRGVLVDEPALDVGQRR